jgi:MFS family permease
MYGRKRIFRFSVVVFLAGSAFCGTAQSMTMPIALRALQGVGGGGLNSLIQAIVGDMTPARERSRYQAYLGIVATVAPEHGRRRRAVLLLSVGIRWGKLPCVSGPRFPGRLTHGNLRVACFLLLSVWIRHRGGLVGLGPAGRSPVGHEASSPTPRVGVGARRVGVSRWRR